jgi:Na+/proline symporter
MLLFPIPFAFLGQKEAAFTANETTDNQKISAPIFTFGTLDICLLMLHQRNFLAQSFLIENKKSRNSYLIGSIIIFIMFILLLFAFGLKYGHNRSVFDISSGCNIAVYMILYYYTIYRDYKSLKSIF